MPPYQLGKNLPPLPMDLLRSFVAAQVGSRLDGFDWPVLQQIWETLLATDHPSGLSANLTQGGVLYEVNGRYGHRALDGVFEELGDVSPTDPKDLPLGLLNWKLVGTAEAAELVDQAAACWERFNKTFKLDSASPKEITSTKFDNWHEKDPQPCIERGGANLSPIDFQSGGQFFRTIINLGCFFPLKGAPPEGTRELTIPPREDCAPATLIAVQSISGQLLGLLYSKAWGCAVYQIAIFADAVRKGLPLYGADLGSPLVAVFESSKKCFGQVAYVLAPAVVGPRIFRDDVLTGANYHDLRRQSQAMYGVSVVETFKGSEQVAIYLTDRHFEAAQPIWVTFPAKSAHGRIPAYDRASHLKVLNRLWRFYGMRRLINNSALLEPDGPLNLPPIVLAGSTDTAAAEVSPLYMPAEARRIFPSLLKHFGGTMLRVDETFAVFRPAGRRVAGHRQVRTPTFGLLPGYYELPTGLTSLKPTEMVLSQTSTGLRVTSTGVVMDIPRIHLDKVTTWMLTDGYTPGGQLGQGLGWISYKGWEKLKQVAPFVTDDLSRGSTGVGFVQSDGKTYLVTTDGSSLVWAAVKSDWHSSDFDVSGMFDRRPESQRAYQDTWAVDVEDADVVDILWGVNELTSARISPDTSGEYLVFEWMLDGGSYQVWATVPDFPDVSYFLSAASKINEDTSQVTLSTKGVRDLTKYLRSVGAKISVVHASFGRTIEMWDGFGAERGNIRATPFSTPGNQISGTISREPRVIGVMPKQLAPILKGMDGYAVTFVFGVRDMDPVYLISPNLCGVVMPTRLA